MTIETKEIDGEPGTGCLLRLINNLCGRKSIRGETSRSALHSCGETIYGALEMVLGSEGSFLPSEYTRWRRL